MTCPVLLAGIHEDISLMNQRPSQRPSRRDVFKAASVMAITAGLPALMTAPAEAVEPIKRVGGPALKISLNAYSFSKLLNDQIKHRGPGISLLDLLDFCAKNEFDGLDPTGYFFPSYPEVPSDEYIN